MKIELLLKREPFFTVLFETLEQFLLREHGIKTKFKSFSGKQYYNKNNSLLCNTKLNIIFYYKLPRNYFNQIIKEFSFNKSFLKRILQTFYVHLAITHPFSYFFSDYIISANSDISYLQDKLILGGNNRIRILDYKKNQSLVILKRGCKNSFFKNELNFRTNYEMQLVPQILVSNTSNSWFSEEIISAKPINRISNKSLYLDKLEIAINDIRRLKKNSIQKCSTKEYLRELSEQIEKLLVSNIFKTIVSDVSQIKATINNLFNNYNSEIFLSVSHGDFQEANILFNDSEVWIIDWENAKIRSAYYDLFTLLLEMRRLNKFSDLFMLAYTGHEFKLNFPEISILDKKDLKFLLLITLLENLVYALDQNDNKNFYTYDDYLLNYINSLKDILTKI